MVSDDALMALGIGLMSAGQPSRIPVSADFERRDQQALMATCVECSETFPAKRADACCC
jgi:hypothetical protein